MLWLGKFLIQAEFNMLYVLTIFRHFVKYGLLQLRFKGINKSLIWKVTRELLSEELEQL